MLPEQMFSYALDLCGQRQSRGCRGAELGPSANCTLISFLECPTIQEAPHLHPAEGAATGAYTSLYC